jgi:hypothetical protein
MTGLNIQAPWSSLLINGLKTVETRTYHLPLKYIGVPLALIETPGKSGRFKSRIIGLITFNESFRYKDKNQWVNDHYRHLVNDGDINYGWKYYKDKYGWIVHSIEKFDSPIDPPKKRGIVFCTNCKVY